VSRVRYELGFIAQKTAFFMVTAVETSNFTLNTLVKNGVFWDVTPCGSYKNRRFGGTWRLLHQGDKNR
jgi:hypothetical protein